MAEWWDGVRQDDPRYPYRGILPITHPSHAESAISETGMYSSRNCDLNEVATPPSKGLDPRNSAV